MTIKFSPSTRGFYDTGVHGDNIPADAIEISEAKHRELLEGQSTGKEIVGGEGGNPVLQAPVVSRPAREAQAWAAIQAERDHRIQAGGFMVRGYWFHSDTFSRTQHLGMFVAGDRLPAGLQWKTMDGRFITMTPELAQEVFLAASSSDPKVFTAAEIHKSKMKASVDPLAYDFSKDWPVSFNDLHPGA